MLIYGGMRTYLIIEYDSIAFNLFIGTIMIAIKLLFAFLSIKKSHQDTRVALLPLLSLFLSFTVPTLCFLIKRGGLHSHRTYIDIASQVGVLLYFDIFFTFVIHKRVHQDSKKLGQKYFYPVVVGFGLCYLSFLNLYLR